MQDYNFCIQQEITTHLHQSACIPLQWPAGYCGWLLHDNGGPTFTHALAPGSPAIASGDDNSCPAVNQRGISRPHRLACDIGAFEFAAAADLSIGMQRQGSGDIGPGASGHFTVFVSIPADALGNDVDQVTVTATPQGDPANSDPAHLTTTVLPVYGVAVLRDEAQFVIRLCHNGIGRGKIGDGNGECSGRGACRRS